MKKLLLILCTFALTGTLTSVYASCTIPPWANDPIVKGDPKINPDIKRPGPFTPKSTQPNPASAPGMNVIGGMITVPEASVGQIFLLMENLETGEFYSFEVLPGTALPAPAAGDDVTVYLYQDGVCVDALLF